MADNDLVSNEGYHTSSGVIKGARIIYVKSQEMGSQHPSWGCAIREYEHSTLTSLEILWRNAGHIRSTIRNGQGGFNETVKESVTLVIYYRNAPM